VRLPACLLQDLCAKGTEVRHIQAEIGEGRSDLGNAEIVKPLFQDLEGLFDQRFLGHGI
jgi:hypothetical protein